jgi:hypothetical protein
MRCRAADGLLYYRVIKMSMKLAVRCRKTGFVETLVSFVRKVFDSDRKNEGFDFDGLVRQGPEGFPETPFGKTLIELDAFIIPNRLVPVEEESASAIQMARVWELYDDTIRFDTFNDDRPGFVGTGLAFPRTVPERWIQLWLVNPKTVAECGDSNVIDHNELHDVTALNNIDKHGFRHTKLSSNFPAFMFEGKQEDDRVTFVYCGVVFVLTLKQTKYRYARFGKFEDAFRYVMN